MKTFAAIFTMTLLTGVGFAVAAPAKVQPRTESHQSRLPVALSNDFEFRKTKLFLCDEKGPAKVGGRLRTSFEKKETVADASINFERQYRLFGAVTGLDQRQRFGHYFDFFWRAKRDASVTVRLEYRQERLRSFVQAREISYARGRGNHRTEFAVIGDDYFDDGHITAWHCLLIADGRIVAEDKSYLWE